MEPASVEHENQEAGTNYSVLITTTVVVQVLVLVANASEDCFAVIATLH